MHGIDPPIEDNNPKCGTSCIFSEWEFPFGKKGNILCPHCMRKEMSSQIELEGFTHMYGLTSGGFDCLHSGHISSFLEGATKVGKLIVVVNGDEFLRRKKGRPFMPLKVRTQIVSAIQGVDYAIPFTATDPEDMGVGEAIEIIRPNYFLKGGDRTNAENIPEWDVCEKVGATILTGVGDDKFWSSSDFLREWKRTSCVDCGSLISMSVRRCMDCR